jgi:adenylate cyclase
MFQMLGLIEAQELAEGLARRAIALDGADAEARSALGWFLWTRGDLEGSPGRSGTVLDDKSKSCTRIWNARLSSGLFRPANRRARGIGDVHQARPSRLNPCNTYDTRGNRSLFRPKYEAAIEAARQAIRSYPDNPHSYRWLAASLGQMGRAGEAKDALEKQSRSRRPRWTCMSASSLPISGWKTTPIC